MPKHVVDATDVAVGNLPGEVNLPKKSLCCGGIAGKVQTNALDCDAFAEFEVFRLEDLAHSPLSKACDDSKPRGEEGANRERGIQAVWIRHSLGLGWSVGF